MSSWCRWKDISTEAYIAGAAAVITAGGKTATAVTDAYGYCTFIDVPFGPYAVTMTKAGYNTAGSTDETLYAGNRNDFVCLYMDDYACVGGTVKASSGAALAGVTVRAEGTGCEVKTDENGAYALRLPAGTYTLQYRREGYARHDSAVSLAPAETLPGDVTMNPTSLTYLYGYVYGPTGDPLSGMKVEAIRTDKSAVTAVYTGPDGRYDMSFALSAPLRIIGHPGDWTGYEAIAGVFLKQGLESRRDVSFGRPPNRARASLWQVRRCASRHGWNIRSPRYVLEPGLGGQGHLTGYSI